MGVVSGYYPLYGLLASMVLLSFAGLPCLHAIRRREKPGALISPVIIPSVVTPESPSQ
jgi:hypothetical protein